MKAGPRDKLIQFQRDIGTTKDSHGARVKSWANYTRAYAAVSFGTGEERREAAQHVATGPATFTVPANPATRALTPADRIAGFLGTDWEISSAVPSGSADMAITATRLAA